MKKPKSYKLLAKILQNIDNKKRSEKECRKCKDTHLTKFGFKMTRNGKIQRYQCLSCGHVQLKK